MSGENCAITHEEFGANLYVDLAIEVKITHNFGYGLYAYEIVRACTSFEDSGKIVWKNASPGEFQ